MDELAEEDSYMISDNDLQTYLNQVILPSADKVRVALASGPEVKRILFSLSNVHLSQFFLFLVDQMVKGLGWKGILVSVDRPFNYLTRIMAKKDINLGRLTIVDIITSLTTGRTEAPENVIVLKSPFCDDIDEGLIDVFCGDISKERDIQMEKQHFLVFDNIAVLDHYIELIYVKRLFVKIESELREYDHLKTILLLDTQRQARVYEAFQGWADKEVVL